MLTTQIVATYVAKNSVPLENVAALIESIHKTLAGLGTADQAEEVVAAPLPAVPVKKSIFPDFIICLEDGKKLKILKRHLARSYGMTPQQYRVKWGLPMDYPMVAPNYAERRSALAKAIGLGRKRAAPPAPEAVAAVAGKRRGRPPKQVNA